MLVNILTLALQHCTSPAHETHTVHSQLIEWKAVTNEMHISTTDVCESTTVATHHLNQSLSKLWPNNVHSSIWINCLPFSGSNAMIIQWNVQTSRFRQSYADFGLPLCIRPAWNVLLKSTLMPILFWKSQHSTPKMTNQSSVAWKIICKWIGPLATIGSTVASLLVTRDKA